MGIPGVKVKKSGAGGAPATNASDGILAIIAAAATGTFLQPALFTNQGAVQTAFGAQCVLADYAVYEIDVSGLPCLAMRSNPSVAGTYGTITSNITGTATVTAGATTPNDHYDVVVTIVVGGALGTTGITYTYSLDGGETVSAVQSLGTGTTLTIPNSGVSFNLSSATHTFIAGDNWSVFTERPLMNNADVTTALTALGQTRLPWEGVLLDCEYLAGTAGLVDTFLAGLEAQGQFCFALLNVRYLNEPTPTAESPATYAAAITTLTQNDASERLCVGADGGHVVSLNTGLNLKRPTSLALGAMAMSLTPNIGTDPAYVGNGPVAGYQIDNGSNPNDWDEGVYQMLDAQRLVTLRSFAAGGPQGVYVCNANVLIPSGSSIVWLQYLRVLNKACRIAWATLITQLGRGVETILNAQTNAINIDPRDAQMLEQLCDAPLRAGLAGQVTAVAFLVNRDDALPTATSPISGEVQVQGKFYLKNMNVTVSLVKTITVPQGAS